MSSEHTYISPNIDYKGTNLDKGVIRVMSLLQLSHRMPRQVCHCFIDVTECDVSHCLRCITDPLTHCASVFFASPIHCAILRNNKVFYTIEYVYRVHSKHPRLHPALCPFTNTECNVIICRVGLYIKTI